MSFYSTTNPANSQVRDPVVQNARNFHFIQRGYHQSQEIDAGSGIDITYTPLQMIQGWIIRTPAAASNDTTPTALEILQGLQSDLNKVSNSAPYVIKNGFWWDFAIYNEGTDEIILGPGSGVVFGIPTSFTIPFGRSVWMRCTIADANTVTPEVYITQLSSPDLP
jgi:hypothetical protein